MPSITGSDASGPTFPRPRTLLPSVSTAIVFHRLVYSNERPGSFSMALETAATPGVYQTEKSSSDRTGTLGTVPTLPR